MYGYGVLKSSARTFKAAPIVALARYENLLLNILVIRACAVGDFILNLPALEALQRCHKTATFTLVGYPATLSLARDFLNIGNIHSIDVPPWSRLFYEPIEDLSFDQAIVWMKNDVVAENLRNSGISRVIHAEPFPRSGHAAAHLLATLALAAPELPDRWNPTNEHIVLHPGSGSPRKNWPHFIELAERLESPVFLVGPAEAEFDTGRFVRMENLELRAVAHTLARSRGFVGNDSGTTHLAAYLGVPTIALFGPTDPNVWGPIGRRVQVMVNPTLVAVQDWMRNSRLK